MVFASVSAVACGESALVADCAEWTLSAATSATNAVANFSGGYPHEQQKNGRVRQFFPTLRNLPACYIDFTRSKTNNSKCNKTKIDTKTNLITFVGPESGVKLGAECCPEALFERI